MSVLLGACAVDGQAPGPAAVAVAVSAPYSTPVFDSSQAETATKPSPPTGDAVVAVSPAKPLALVGMDDRAVLEALGQPALRRHDQPAQYWLYSDHRCTLDLFFYLDPDTGKSRVTYYELHRPRGAQPVSEICGPTLAHLAPMGTDTAMSEPVAH